MPTETNVKCFKCGLRNGIDCAGRKEGESTLCTPCFMIQLAKDKYEQAFHLLNMLNNNSDPESNEQERLTLEQFYKFCKEFEIDEPEDF